MPMLLGIAMYTKTMQKPGLFSKAPLRPEFRRSDYFAGHSLRNFESHTLAKFNAETDTTHVHHFRNNNEHYYVMLLPGANNLISIVSKSVLHPKEVGYLFLNIQHIYRTNEAVNQNLQKIINNPLEFMNMDMLIAKTQQSLDDLLVLLRNIEDKILERGDRLELLSDKTFTLNLDSKEFKTKSEDLNRCCF